MHYWEETYLNIHDNFCVINPVPGVWGYQVEPPPPKILPPLEDHLHAKFHPDPFNGLDFYREHTNRHTYIALYLVDQHWSCTKQGDFLLSRLFTFWCLKMPKCHSKCRNVVKMSSKCHSKYRNVVKMSFKMPKCHQNAIKMPKCRQNVIQNAEMS